MSVSKLQYRGLPPSKRKDLRTLWSLAFRTREDTFMDGWQNKTPRPKPATKHERRAKRKAKEKTHDVAHPVLKSRPLSGLHTIPPQWAAHHPEEGIQGRSAGRNPEPQAARKRETETSGRATTETDDTGIGNGTNRASHTAAGDPGGDTCRHGAEGPRFAPSVLSILNGTGGIWIMQQTRR